MIGSNSLFACDHIAEDAAIGAVEEDFAANCQPFNVGEGGWNVRRFAEAQDVSPEDDVFTLPRFSAVDVPTDFVIEHNRYVVSIKPDGEKLAVEIDVRNNEPYRRAVAGRGWCWCKRCGWR